MTQLEYLNSKLTKRERVVITDSQSKRLFLQLFVFVSIILIGIGVSGLLVKNLLFFVGISIVFQLIWYFLSWKFFKTFSDAALHGDVLTLTVFNGKRRITTVRSIRKMATYPLILGRSLTKINYHLDGEKVSLYLLNRLDSQLSMPSEDAIRIAQKIAC